MSTLKNKRKLIPIRFRVNQEIYDFLQSKANKLRWWFCKNPSAYALCFNNIEKCYEISINAIDKIKSNIGKGERSDASVIGLGQEIMIYPKVLRWVHVWTD